MKHKTFKKTTAKLPEREKIVGGPACKETMEERRKEINKLLQEVEEEAKTSKKQF